MFLSKTGEPVQEETWQWYVVYSDDETLSQFDHVNQKYHYFNEIERDRVVAFGMFNPQTNQKIETPISDNEKLIHFYENIIQQPIGGTAIHHRLYCFGYEQGKTKKLKTILPNGFIVQADASVVEAI